MAITIIKSEAIVIKEIFDKYLVTFKQFSGDFAQGGPRIAIFSDFSLKELTDGIVRTARFQFFQPIISETCK